MRKYLLIFGFTLAGACQQDSGQMNDKNLVSKEVFTTRIGDKQVYGVQLRATGTTDKSFGAYAIELSVGEKTWLDTLKMELNPGDTLESEVIFSEAQVQKSVDPELKIEAIDFE